MKAMTTSPQAVTVVQPWDEMVEQFLDEKAHSDHTKRNYRRHVKQALSFITGAVVTSNLRRALTDYRKSVVDSTLSPGSQGQAIAAIRSFMLWSLAEGLHPLSGDIIRATLKMPKATGQRPYNALTEPEASRMIATAATERDRAILALMIGAGLRVAEVAALDVSHILEGQEGGAAVWVKRGKGSKSRVVPIQDDVLAHLRAYLEVTGRTLGQDGPLFRSYDRGAASRDRKRLTDRAMAYMVKTTAARAGIVGKRVSCHSLRHTFGLRAIRAHGDVVALSKLMGHSSISTTQGYANHRGLQELRRFVPALPSDSSD